MITITKGCLFKTIPTKYKVTGHTGTKGCLFKTITLKYKVTLVCDIDCFMFAISLSHGVCVITFNMITLLVLLGSCASWWPITTSPQMWRAFFRAVWISVPLQDIWVALPEPPFNSTFCVSGFCLGPMPFYNSYKRYFKGKRYKPSQLNLGHLPGPNRDTLNCRQEG